MRIKKNGYEQSLNEVVLFAFDDYAIPLQRGVKLCLHGTGKRSWDKKKDIVMGLGEPGDPDSIICTYYGSVKRVGDELWMWYCGQGNLDEENWHQRLCLAVSKDGRNWEKPQLGLAEYGGSKDNNLIDFEIEDHVQACVVYHDPDDPDPARRFKMAFESSRYNWQLAVAFSADGLKWKVHPGNPLGPKLEPAGGTKFDGVYYLSGQNPDHWAADGGARTLVTHLAYDFEHWSQASCLGHRRDTLPPRPIQFGSANARQVHLGAALWNRGNTLIGIYGMWNQHPSGDRRLTWMDLGLLVSHDALHFREPVPDFPIVKAQEIGWELAQRDDAAAHFPALIQGQGFENIGDETLFWYAPWPEHASDGVRLAVWPRDRLGHLEAFDTADGESYVVTQCVSLEGKRAGVSLNVGGLSKHAQIKVSVLDERLNVLDGYGSEDCTKPEEPGLRQLVRWGSRDVISVDEPIRLRIDMTGIRREDVELYAVYLEIKA